MTYLRKRKSAFMYAIKGLGASLKNESHMRIHLCAALLAICFAFYFHVESWQWVAILLSITLVIISELFNTAVEKMCDLITTEQRPEIGYIKDISAGAVLLSCFFAIAVALVVFLPHIGQM
jgi:diacylglycerol kinase